MGKVLARSPEKFYIRRVIKKSLKLSRPGLEFYPCSLDRFSVPQLPRLKIDGRASEND